MASNLKSGEKMSKTKWGFRPEFKFKVVLDKVPPDSLCTIITVRIHIFEPKSQEYQG